MPPIVEIPSWRYPLKRCECAIPEAAYAGFSHSSSQDVLSPRLAIDRTLPAERSARLVLGNQRSVLCGDAVTTFAVSPNTIYILHRADSFAPELRTRTSLVPWRRILAEANISMATSSVRGTVVCGVAWPPHVSYLPAPWVQTRSSVHQSICSRIQISVPHQRPVDFSAYRQTAPYLCICKTEDRRFHRYDLLAKLTTCGKTRGLGRPPRRAQV